jgi:uncharacterized membrane protein
MAGVAIVLSFGLIQLDTMVNAEWVTELTWLYSFGPEGARAVLSAIASSMITVAGLTFSITMLTLQLASSQFGPRLLRNFMRDRGNQIVLGTFIATFIYCLLVLRTVRGTEESSFVPHLSVAVGVLLALASIAVLIYFIHHVATSIRIESLLKTLSAETRATIDHLYPERLGHDPPNEPSAYDLPQVSISDTRSIFAGSSGYMQRVDVDALMRLATDHDLVIYIDARPGRFVTESDSVLRVHPADRASDDIDDTLSGTFIIGQERTPEQDLEFSIRRIVEIAQRALSPGINDPTTALYCIDRLGEAFERLALRHIPAPMRFDEDRLLRVVTEVISLDELACPAFAAVARYGMTDADVVRHLLDTMKSLQRVARLAESSQLIRMIDEIGRQSAGQLCLDFDRRAIQAPSRSGAPVPREPKS